MKITTTTTKQIEIELPAFTKVDKTYFCVKDEVNITSFTKYDYASRITSIISHHNTEFDAFRQGFEFITKEEFFENYNELVDTLYDKMKDLQDYMDTDWENEKNEEEGFEYDPDTESMVR